MRSKLFLVFVALSVCLAARAQSVNENGAQIVLGGDTAKVILPVESPGEVRQARARIEIVDQNDVIKAAAEETRDLTKGPNTIDIPIDLAGVIQQEDFRFYRLRYDVGGKTGVISLARTAGDIFDLEAFSFDYPQDNSRYMIRVRAIHPVTLKGAGSVKLEGKLEVEFNKTGKKIVEVNTVTDPEGFAALVFQLPEYEKIDDLKVTIQGSKNGFVNKISESLSEQAFTRYSYLYFQTDKPIYQPGQMLRVRSLFFDDKKKAIADDPLTFTIKDEDGTILSKTETRTSRFGIASLEWQIPDNVKLGEYSIAVSSDRELFRDQKQFNVSRYDLPNFSVAAKADRKYYLPDQNKASVDVTADYLFGKPLTSAKVRVVEEEDRTWNSLLHKYDVKEGQVREGTIDPAGKFTAVFDLTEAHKDFEDGYRRFEDKHFVAYVTDLTTNRTEQRRFDIRITKQAIHVYLVSQDENYSDISKRLPGRFYLTAFYPDGTPAPCDFAIYQARDDSDDDDPKAGKLLLKGKTDQLGAARVRLPLDIRDHYGYEEDELDLVIKAKDRAGNKGVQTRDLDFDLIKPAVEIATDKIVYKKGDQIKISVLSSVKDSNILLSIMRGTNVIVNEKIRLEDGKAEIDIPYNERLKGPLQIAAYGSYRDEDGDTEIYSGTCNVVYPVQEGMSISATSSKEVYRPGEDATIELASFKPGGDAVESAFGISILDKAIDERARTDSDFGRRYESFYSDFADLLGFSGEGGFSRDDLNRLDTSKPISPEAELAIEIALRTSFRPDLVDSGNFQSLLSQSYQKAMSAQLKDVAVSLQKRYTLEALAAIDEASLRNILAMDSIDLNKKLDPWGNHYRVAVFKWKATSEIKIISDGPDEIADTQDDITAYENKFEYFKITGNKIDKAFLDFQKRTGNFIRDYKTLRDEMKLQGEDLDALRDLWGKPYRFTFGIDASRYFVKIESGGWDRKFGKYDDFPIWTYYVDYFIATRANMADAVRKQVRETGKFPADENELKAALKGGGNDLDVMRDAFGKPFIIEKETKARYADRRKIGNASAPEITPVSQDLVMYSIKSIGMDGVKGTSDDFELIRFIGIVSEKTGQGQADTRAKSVPSSSGSLGGVAGTATDVNGAVIPGVSVKAELLWRNSIFEARSDAAGTFVLSDLPPGIYEISFAAPGFRRLVVQSVTVESAMLTELNITLAVDSVNETVSVTGSAEVTVNTSDTEVTFSSAGIRDLPINGRRFQDYAALMPSSARSGLRDATGIDRDPSVAGSSGPENSYIVDGVGGKKRLDLVKEAEAAAKTREQIETPRLREYFPETLAWFPELISGPDGKASFKFKLADNLTTWKVAVIGSTANGDIAVAEKEIKTFQPFFVDLDPPKFLTKGDEISLPVQVRNYTGKKQNVDVTMTKADWFSFLGSEQQEVDVEPANSQNAIFGFKATGTVKEGKQRVTAIANSDSDAIEKPVTVRPDGEEIVKTDSRFFSGSTAFDVNFPAKALPKTQKAELKIYPNLLSHVAESVEGLLRRPNGCGEQTISSTYPNLMILKFVKDDSNLRQTARKYLQKGYERLLGYQLEEGAFSYWGGKDKPDVALTAYAIRFLNDAKGFIAVDDDVITNASDWLTKQQRADGSWINSRYYYGSEEDPRITRLFTAYVARGLAIRKGTDNGPLQKALAYLKTSDQVIDEPYVMALHGLALVDAGEMDAARIITEKLEKMAIAEGDSVYWNLETNTPFYGWGTAGRLETTALVLQLLIRQNVEPEKMGERTALIGKATLFLLRNKDRYGVWYSTQTTINVLDAFLAALDGTTAKADKIRVALNGSVLTEIAVEAGRIEPLHIDLTGSLDAVTNKIEVTPASNSALMAQVVSTHYIDWRDSTSTGQITNHSRTMRFDYTCDKTSVAIMQDVTCTVDTERIGFRGYGMLLAEIGTPPGADVSRESLQKALDDWSISRYDILPDRIVVYMWAKAGGTKFSFKFRPRYGINAQTPASVAYDYYNPEAKAVAAPLRFEVSGKQ